MKSEKLSLITFSGEQNGNNFLGIFLDIKLVSFERMCFVFNVCIWLS